MASDTSLVFNLLAKDNVSKTVDGVGGKFKKLGTVVAGLGVGAAAGLLKLGMDFEEAYNTIQKGTGATGEDLEGLEKNMRNVMSVNPAGMEDVSQAIADLNTLTGASGKPLEDMANQFLNLKKVSGEALDASTITRVFGDWGIKAKDTGTAMDRLWKVSQTTGVKVQDLSDTVVKFGGPMRGMGFTFDQTTALVGKFHQAGVNTDTVLSSMRIGLGKLAKAGEDPKTAFSRLTTEIQNSKSPVEATKLAMQLFGAKAGPDMAAAIREGKFSLDDLNKKLAESKTTINGTAEKTLTLHDKMNLLKNKGFVALEPVASAMIENMQKFMDKLAPIGKWMQDNPGKVKLFAGIVLGLGAAALTVAIGIKAWELASKAAKIATQLWTAAQWLFNAAMDANPVALLVIGIVALIAIIVLIATKTDWFQKLWSTAWGFIKTAVSDVWNWISANWPLILGILTGPIGLAVVLILKHWTDIKNGIKAAWNWIVKNVLSPIGTFFTKTIPGYVTTLYNRVKGAWDNIKSAIHAAWLWIRNNVGAPINTFFTKTIPGYVTTLYNRVKTGWTNIYNYIKGKAADVYNSVSSKFTSLVTFVKGLPGKITSATKGMFDGIKNAFKSAINTVIRWWNNLHMSLSIPKVSLGPLGSIGGGSFTLSTPNIPLLAKGGDITRGGSVIVGDAGPERLSLPRGARVTPLKHGASGSDGDRRIVLEVRSSGTRTDNMLVEILQEAIRVRGGDVQAVLGK